MNVRARLVTGSLLVALFVLLIFGTLSFKVTTDSNREVELKLLRSHALNVARWLQLSLEQGQLPAANTLSAQENSDYSTAAYLVTPDGHTVGLYLFQYDSSPSLNEASLRALRGMLEDRGSIELQNTPLLWAHAPVGDTGYSVYALLDKGQSRSGAARQLIGRLLVIGLIAIWLAIWIALIVARRIVFHIDAQNSQLVYQALHDHLTGLPNRNHLFNWLDTLSSEQPKARHELAIMDLNNFKEINDTLGHYAGDQLLQMISKRLSLPSLEAAFVARLGGDEFAAVFPYTDEHSTDVAIDKLRGALATPFNVNGLDIMATCSIGISHYPAYASEPGLLIKQAEIAMYQAKDGRRSALVYNPEDDPFNIRRLALMNELGTAIEEDQLVLYFQPKVDIREERVVGVESLIRWQHPEHGMVAPDEFIHSAEKSLLIDKLTIWILEHGIRQCKDWLEQGMELVVAINISVQNLQDNGLADHIQRMLEYWQVPPQYIKLEITESAMMADPVTALKNLNTLHNMGLQLSIDDFGTGYSSLSYLKQLPVSELKIDKSFVEDMLHDENDLTIVRSTIDLAHNLGCLVVGEGVEDEQTLQLLKDLNCDVVQGYYYSRPIPAAQLLAWVRRKNGM